MQWLHGAGSRVGCFTFGFDVQVEIAELIQGQGLVFVIVVISLFVVLVAA